MKKESMGIIQIILASVLFGIIPIFVRYGIDFGVYNLAFFRIFASAILLGLFFMFAKSKLAKFRHEKGKLILFGAVHGFIILGYFIAIQYLSVASAVLLLYSSSIWMVIFSYFILKEKIKKITLFALAISILGLILVVSPNNFFIRESLIGSIAGLLGGVGFGLVYVLSKTFKKYDKVSLTFWQNLIALPFLLPLIFIQLPVFNFKNLLVITVLGIITVLAFILVFIGLGKVSAQKAGVITLLDAIFPIIFALILFKEVPSIKMIIGAVLIMTGSYIVSRNN